MSSFPKQSDPSERDNFDKNGRDDAVNDQRPNDLGEEQQSRDPKQLDDHDLSEYIYTLEDHRRLCEREGKYVEAELAQKRINDLQDELNERRIGELRVKHEHEKLQLEEAHRAEFNQFNEYWDKKMAEFNEQAALAQEQLVQKHQEDLKNMVEELETTLPLKPKESVELLNVRKIQLYLAKQKDYAEAHKAQQKANRLEKQETDKWLAIREQKIRNLINQTQNKQEVEQNALKHRIIIGQDEQKKARSLDLERLLQKYQNIKKQLENEQQQEILRVAKPGKGGSKAGSLFISHGNGSRFMTTGEKFNTKK